MVTGHTRKRPSKNGKPMYQIVIEFERDPLTGKRQRQYKTVQATQKQAEAILRKMLDEVNLGGIVNASSRSLASWMKEWLTLYLPNIEATTRAGYEESINNRLLPYLGHIPLNALQTATVQAWVNKLSTEQKLSPKTVRNVFLNLSSALDKAVLIGMIARNPCTGVVLPKAVKPKFDVYDTHEIHQMLDAATGTDMYLPLLLAISLGLRRGELLALTWDAIDFEKNVIHITRNTVLAGREKITKAPKSASGIRDIHIGENVRTALVEGHQRYLEDKAEQGTLFHDTNLVVRQHNGKAYSPDSFTQKWERFVKQHGLKEIRLHDLRHSNATALFKAGVDAAVIKERLGHADIGITLNTYTHILPSVNQEAGNKIDTVIFDN